MTGGGVKDLIGLAFIVAGALPAPVALGKSAIVIFPRERARPSADPLEPLTPVRITVGRALDIEGAAVSLVRPIMVHVAAGAPFAATYNVSSRQALAQIAGAMPLASARMTSGFGMRWHPVLGGERMHSGVDLAAPAGTPVASTADGIVGEAGWNGGYGLYVAISHPGGVQTRYGHMSQLAVSAGQAVRAGQLIGYVGSTGRSTGPHLHYEMRLNGLAVRPVAFVHQLSH